MLTECLVEAGYLETQLRYDCFTCFSSPVHDPPRWRVKEVLNQQTSTISHIFVRNHYGAVASLSSLAHNIMPHNDIFDMFKPVVESLLVLSAQTPARA